MQGSMHSAISMLKADTICQCWESSPAESAPGILLIIDVIQLHSTALVSLLVWPAASATACDFQLHTSDQLDTWRAVLTGDGSSWLAVGDSWA